MTLIEFIQQSVDTTSRNIEKTIGLLQEDCTIPFIARYRKDHTGNLDEVAIENIAKSMQSYDALIKRKESILVSIEEQGSLTDTLRENIAKSFDLVELEDLYLPFKKKRKTKASIARENGLEPLAKIIMAQRSEDLSSIASKNFEHYNAIKK